MWTDPGGREGVGDCGGGADDWEAWLERHGAALTLFARQFSLNQADAEDAVQEAFVRAWQARATLRDPLAYVFGSVKHCALEKLRREKRLKNREHSLRMDACFEPPNPEDSDAHALRRNELGRALNMLPDNQRETLVLKIWGGLTFPQIGEALQIPPDTAASRYRAALLALRASGAAKNALMEVRT